MVNSQGTDITPPQRETGSTTIDTTIKLAVLALMAIATYRITSPFIMPVAWGIIIAIAVEPLICFLSNRINMSRKTLAVLFSLFVIAALIIPSFLITSQSIDVVQTAIDHVERDALVVPPPPQEVAEWPVIGEPLHKSWTLASTNLEAALQQFAPQLKEVAVLLLSKAGNGIKVVFMFVISVAIAGALLATSEKGSAVATRITTRLAGDAGPQIKKLSIATVRGVMQGVIGVAVIQSILSLVGMAAVGVPASGFWAFLVLILAVIQLPPVLILGPVAAWVFTFADTLPAVIFLVWALAVSGCDGILKPILMGRGVDAPMLVILIGALGGMMLSGIIGLFVGAVIVSISYTLFMAWIDEEKVQTISEDNG